MAAPKARKRSTAKVVHAWSEHCDHVNVYRVLRSNGREVRVILGHRYAPEEVSDELALKRLHGPGHFVLSPRTEGNAICGDEKRFIVPNEDGSIPPMAVEGDGTGGFGQVGGTQGRDGPPNPWELLRGFLADQRAAQKELLAEQREARKADMQAMAAQFDNFAKVIVAQVGGEKSDGVFFKRLEKFEKDAADLRQKLHEKELSIAKKASGVEDFVTDVAKSVGPDVVRTFLGVGAPASSSGSSGASASTPALTAATVPLETLLSQLPPADEIARDLAAGKTMDADEITCYTRLATAGKLSDDHRRVVGGYLSQNLWKPG